MTEDDRVVRRECTRFLSGNVSVTPAALMRRLADRPDAVEAADVYGEGGAVRQLEQHVAELLGKPAALFFAKGMVAQMSALRVHAERARSDAIALHPQSHFDVDELDALYRVARLQPVRLGRYMPFCVEDLGRINGPLAAVTIELPLRRAGYLLPAWDELERISAWCRERSVALHIDGARIWEAAAAYGVKPADIAALADTIYVSFYKGLGGLGGAMLVGDADVVAAAKPWRLRFGGNLYTAYPLALSALDGLERQLSRMADYVAKARELADAIEICAPRIIHRPPLLANAFQTILPGPPAVLAKHNRHFGRSHGVWLFNSVVEAPIAGHSIGEVVVGDASDRWAPSEAAEWIVDFAAMA